MAQPPFPRLTAKLYGPPPSEGASRLERLRYIRGIAVRSLLLYVPIFAVILPFGASTWLILVIAVLFALGAANVLSLHLKVRRAENGERDG